MGKQGRHWYNNGVKAIICDENSVPDGFVRGTLPEHAERMKQLSNNCAGKKKSEEHRKKIGESTAQRLSSKENHPMYGKHHTEETRNKMRESKLGCVPSHVGPMSDEQKEHREQSIINKYGSMDNFYRISTDKSREKKLSLYGDENYNNREKAKSTIKKNPNFYSDRAERTRETKIEKYGSLDAATKHRQETLTKKYGFDSFESYCVYWRDHILKNRNKKNTSLESRFLELLLNNGIDFINQYTVKLGNLSHQFDFAILKDNKLDILVDLDEKYFHGYLSDTNGKSINNYSDEYRMMLVPDGVKFITIVEGDEKSGYNDFLSYYNENFIEYKKQVFDWCRKVGFPFPKYSEKVLRSSWNSLINSDGTILNPRARYGEKLINHFHESIFYANKYGKPSPYDAWNNDKILTNCIDNRIIYRGTDLDPSRVLCGLSASMIAPKVSIFNPYVAKYIVNTYLSEFTEIFDPFSGFSGRLLGALACEKNYIGQDIDKRHIEESEALLRFIGKTAKLSTENSEKTTGEYECLFTCPPYGNKESWGEHSEIKTCDEWIDTCLKNYKCKKYVFIVDETSKYSNNIVGKIINKSHISQNCEYIVSI